MRLAAVLLATGALGGVARAEVTRTVLVPSVGLRVHTGQVAEQYPWSMAVRVLTALQPLAVGDTFRLGPAWWGELDFLGSTTQAALGGELYMAHLGLGLRAEVGLPGVPWVDLTVLLGGELVATAPPAPPGEGPRAFGPLAGLGTELALSRALVLSLDVAYGLAGTSTTGVTILVGLQLGD